MPDPIKNAQDELKKKVEQVSGHVITRFHNSARDTQLNDKEKKVTLEVIIDSFNKMLQRL